MKQYSRRQLLVMGTGAGATLVGVMLSIPALGFLLSPLFTKKRIAWVQVGPVDDVPTGQRHAVGRGAAGAGEVGDSQRSALVAAIANRLAGSRGLGAGGAGGEQREREAAGDRAKHGVHGSAYCLIWRA